MKIHGTYEFSVRSLSSSELKFCQIEIADELNRRQGLMILSDVDKADYWRKVKNADGIVSAVIFFKTVYDLPLTDAHKYISNL